MDEEELLDHGELNGGYGSHVHFSNDINPLEEDLDESTPLLLPSTYRTRDGASPLANFFYNLYGQFLHFFNDDRTFTVKPGTNYDLNQTFKNKLPKGKKICVPVRIEPKVYFANERTFLSWLSIGMILGATATTLLTYGGNSTITASIGFFIAALFTMIYSTYRYVWRVLMIREKKAVMYGDKFGPNMICFFIAAATFATFLFRFIEA